MTGFAVDALALLVGLALPAGAALQQLAHRRERVLPEAISTADRIRLYWSNSAVLLLLGAGVLAAWLLDGRAPESLGLGAPARFEAGLVLATLFTVGIVADSWRELSPGRLPATRARWRRHTPFMPTGSREQLHALVLVLSASFAEELLYRGFLISWLRLQLGGSAGGLAIAVALPALVFGAAHLYQGARAVVRIVLLSAVFGAIFVVTGSIWIPVGLHLLVDLQAVVLGPRLLAGSGATSPPPGR